MLALSCLRKFPAARDFDSIARALLSNARSDGGDNIFVDSKKDVEAKDPDISYQAVEILFASWRVVKVFYR